MFLNDIEDIYLHSGLPGIDVNTFKMFLILYADDIVIFANSSQELQTSLNLLEQYCIQWRLTVNTSKTKVMIFRKGGRNNQNLSFTYKHNAIEIVNKFTYLGIVFTTGGSFNEAQNTLSGQALKALFTMNKYLYKFTDVTVKHRLDLFEKLIVPILNYGSEVWGFNKGQSIERLHLQFCKNILCVKRSTQNDFVYGELGRVSMQNNRHFNIIKYWIKLLQCNENKFAKKVYNLLKNDFENNQNKANWCSQVKALLCSLGFQDVWIMQGVGNVKLFLLTVNQRLKDTFVQNWSGRLSDSSRALFYNNIKSFEFQEYLNLVNIKKIRICITKLRVSSHRLHIESGRWSKPVVTPVENRTCFFCDKLEDEYHFIMECDLYKDLRDKYIPKFFRTRPSMHKFIQLLQTTNRKVLRNFGTYIFYSFELRKQYLYQ